MRSEPNTATHRVEIGGPEGVLGSIWARRPSGAAPLSIEETRLLAATADLIGQALTREHLVGAAAELEISRRSDDLKSALLDSVTHDLRTPLASIRAAAGSLADKTISLTAEERRAAAASIDREALRLNRLVGNLLDMSRIRAGVLVPHRELVPLEELTDPPVERASTRLGGRHLAVEIAPDLPPLWVDPVLLDEALANLLDNAIRHTPASSSIQLTAAPSSVRDSVLITVEDDGPGVPADQLSRLFERFAPGAGHRSGFGLGLAVARGMVEAMGGTISAARALGGLAVTIVLPDSGGGRRVIDGCAELLLVEDDEPMREAVASNLAAHGYPIREAATGEAALRRGTGADPTWCCSTLDCPTPTASRGPPRAARCEHSDHHPLGP